MDTAKGEVKLNQTVEVCLAAENKKNIYLFRRESNFLEFRKSASPLSSEDFFSLFLFGLCNFVISQEL